MSIGTDISYDVKSIVSMAIVITSFLVSFKNSTVFSVINPEKILIIVSRGGAEEGHENLRVPCASA